MAHNSYTQVQLPMGNSSTIRLLEVLPSARGDGKDIISCRLRLATVDEPYTALSYVWGDQSQQIPITLNGQSTSVGQNLWNFLRQSQHYQALYGTELLWIDALCIDQASVLEKNHQVAMMGSIYSQAARVVIWLGAEGAQFINMLENIDDFGPADIHLDRKIKEHPTAFLDLQHFCTHQYWRRAWTFQEFVLARELLLQCGPRRFLETTIERTIAWFRLFFSEHTDKSWQWNARPSWSSQWSAPIRITPWMLTQTECFDPRDRIYSMISLMDPVLPITPDYGKSALDLLLEIAHLYRGRPRNLEGDLHALARTLDLLPSWPWTDGRDLSPAVRGRIAEARLAMKTAAFLERFPREASLSRLKADHSSRLKQYNLSQRLDYDAPGWGVF